MKNIVRLLKLLLVLFLGLEAKAIPSYPEIYVYDNQDPTLLDAPTDTTAEPLISDP